MKLLVDFGNTRLKWALLDRRQLRVGGVFAHAGVPFVAELRRDWAELARIEAVLVASVVAPAREAELDGFVRERFGAPAQFPRRLLETQMDGLDARPRIELRRHVVHQPRQARNGHHPDHGQGLVGGGGAAVGHVSDCFDLKRLKHYETKSGSQPSTPAGAGCRKHRTKSPPLHWIRLPTPAGVSPMRRDPQGWHATWSYRCERSNQSPEK